MLLSFLTFGVLVANPKKLLYTVANPACGLLNRGKKKKRKSLAAPPPRARCPFGEKKKKITRRIYMPRCYAGLGPSRVCTRIPSTRRLGQWVSLGRVLRFRVNNFPSLAASLFSWRCLAACTSSFLHAAMNLRPLSATVSTHTSATNAVAF